MFFKSFKSESALGIIQDLSNLKFDSEGGTTILKHTARFLEFCTYYEIHCEDIACRLFILTFKACVKE